MSASILILAMIALGSNLARAENVPGSLPRWRFAPSTQTGRFISWPEKTPLPIPSQVETIEIDQINSYRPYQMRELDANGSALVMTEHTIVRDRTLKTSWVHWTTGPTDPVACGCADGRIFRPGPKLRAANSFIARYEVQGFDWYASKDKPDEALCFPHWKISAIVPQTDHRYDHHDFYYLKLDEPSEHPLSGVATELMPTLKGAVRLDALRPLNIRTTRAVSDSGDPWVNPSVYERGNYLAPQPQGGDLNPLYREETLDQLEDYLGSAMLSASHACNSDPAYPSVELSGTPIERRYSLRKGNKDGQSVILGVDTIEESFKEPVVEAKEHDFTQDRVDLNTAPAMATDDLKAAGVGVRGDVLGTQAIFNGDYVVVRKDASFRKVRGDGKISPEAEAVEFLSYARIGTIHPDGTVQAELFRLRRGSVGWTVLKWALAPGAYIGTAIVNAKGLDRARVDSVSAVLQLSDLMPAMDFLDLVAAGSQQQPEVPK